MNAAGSIPLFDVRLQVGVDHSGQPRVSVVPGLQDIEHALTNIVDGMVAAVKVIQTFNITKACKSFSFCSRAAKRRITRVPLIDHQNKSTSSQQNTLRNVACLGGRLGGETDLWQLPYLGTYRYYVPHHSARVVG